MSAPKRRTAAELRTGLKHATERMRDLRQSSIEMRDIHLKDSEFWSVHHAEVRAYTLSLHVLFCNTGGEFGEDFPEDGAQ